MSPIVAEVTSRMKKPDTETAVSATMADGLHKRVVLFTGAYNHIADGVSLTLNRLVAYLLRTGSEVLVFAPTVENPPVEHSGTMVAVPSVPALGRSEYRVSYAFPRAARERFEAFEPNLVHIATPDILGFKALRYARRRGIPVVGSYHTHFASYLKYYRLGLLEGAVWRYLRWFYGQCEHVYVPSPSMMEVLRQKGFRENLREWARGVDISLFTPERRSQAWRKAHGIGEDEVVVALVSRLVWEKNLETFAEVVEELSRRGVPHRSLIVGDGPAYDELRARLPETIFTGYLEGEELATAYASSDVFLFPSDTESFGNVILEAMASGLPTVCAEATGSNSLVRPGKTGYLVPVDDTGDFTARVASLVQDAERRQRMGRAALEEARRYEWQAILAAIDGYYDEVLAQRSAAAPSLSDATV